jgi:hypothetical protein
MYLKDPGTTGNVQLSKLPLWKQLVSYRRWELAAAHTVSDCASDTHHCAAVGGPVLKSLQSELL